MKWMRMFILGGYINFLFSYILGLNAATASTPTSYFYYNMRAGFLLYSRHGVGVVFLKIGPLIVMFFAPDVPFCICQTVVFKITGIVFGGCGGNGRNGRTSFSRYDMMSVRLFEI
jgi:hypothetical protein